MNPTEARACRWASATSRTREAAAACIRSGPLGTERLLAQAGGLLRCWGAGVQGALLRGTAVGSPHPHL